MYISSKNIVILKADMILFSILIADLNCSLYARDQNLNFPTQTIDFASNSTTRKYMFTLRIDDRSMEN